MISKPCVVDYWRNDVPVAPALTLETPNNVDFEIPLRSIMIQGARDFKTSESPSEGVLDKVPVQRGWRLTLIPISQPIHGSVKLSVDGESFIYTPLAGFVGQDCFAYAVTNGYQQSVVSNLTINCRRGYEYSLNVFRRNIDRTQHRMVVAPAFDFDTMNLPHVHMVYAAWYYDQYREVKDGKVTRIKKQRTLIGNTSWNRSFYDQVLAFAPTILNSGLSMTVNTFFDDILASGLLEDTAQTFKPQHLAGDVVIKLNLYTETKQTPLPADPTKTFRQLDLNKFTEIEFTVVERYGIRWTDSGNIQI
ncbi:hypothetical protein JA33_135 [Dickeya phage vB_DsoM_JA33]|uniref:Uncharacterized protein n=2 Tax=Salmondvirus JA11 TaxID=2734141 RepID=A0A386K5K3_9CAUD|nr:hypothetical protein HOU32_gp135 [Dickeya phage vB_DsoM_JA11]AXG67509.1 hypothetical protein JA33_135 [Dickeya phage vB_DsoM_JA33]AYD79940.1 hypothetical protein JA11_135 [Dickeya phage vB_DsoM_JA11]